MKIRIISSFRISEPKLSRHGFMWEGDVPIGFSGHVGSTNEALYRFFQRVENEDGRRLSKIGYTLPSLSAGDVLIWVGDNDTHSRMFLVDGAGFTPIMPGLGVIGNDPAAAFIDPEEQG